MAEIEILGTPRVLAKSEDFLDQRLNFHSPLTGTLSFASPNSAEDMTVTACYVADIVDYDEPIVSVPVPRHAFEEQIVGGLVGSEHRGQYEGPGGSLVIEADERGHLRLMDISAPGQGRLMGNIELIGAVLSGT